MGTDQTRKLSPFGIAAVAFDQELQRFQQLTELARRTGLDSRKSLDKAAHAAEEATASHKRLGERMATLAAELQQVRARNEETVGALHERKLEITARMGEVGSLVDRVNLLGKAAAEVSRAVKLIGAGAKQDTPGKDALGELGALMTQMDALLEQARLLARTAQEAKLVELAAEIESIRAQIHAARNKMNLLRERLEQMLARGPTARG